MRKCSCCKDIKEDSEFYFKVAENRYNSFCNSCLYKYQAERFKRRKLEAIEYKGGCCSKCGYNKYYGALDFHHLKSEEKEFSWNKMRLVSKERLLKELDKCELICSNCHRELHKKE